MNPAFLPQTETPDVADAGADLRAARVDLYCDHDADAMAHVRRARETILATGGVRHGDALSHLAQAQWLAGQHRYPEAQSELGVVLDQLQQRG